MIDNEPMPEPETTDDAETRRERAIRVIDEHMDKHRNLYDKLARE